MNATSLEKKPAAPTTSATEPAPQRLMSLDALRGFDMFWIIGGGTFLGTLAARIGNEPFLKLVQQQTDHVAWEGFRAWDLIFPLFVFMSGVTMPFALVRQWERGESRGRLVRRLLRRMLLLVFLGMLPGLLSFDGWDTRFYSVLGLIGVANFLGGLIVLYRPPRSQFLWALGILLGYGLALCYIPVPEVGPGTITPGGVLNGYIDRNLAPGRLYGGVFDPEGMLTMLPAAALVLFGALAGRWLRRSDLSGAKKTVGLLLAGGVLLGAGTAGAQVLPVVKALWSSTFILVAAGWSLLLLALFYLVIDVWRWRWLGWIWVPIGMNAITIYVLRGSFVDFRYTAHHLFDGVAKQLEKPSAELLLAFGLLLVEWAFLYFLYRKKIFLRA